MEEVGPPWVEKLESSWVEKVNTVFPLDGAAVMTPS